MNYTVEDIVRANCPFLKVVNIANASNSTDDVIALIVAKLESNSVVRSRR